MILIVGCGFLGSYLLNEVVKNTDEPVIATVRDIKKAPEINGVDFVKCDVTNENDLISLAKKCKNETLTVFYFAACHYIDYIFENPEESKKNNIVALKKFLAIFSNTDKFFFASTDCVYGENTDAIPKFKEASVLAPVNEYGKQKAEAEAIVNSYGFTVLRLPFMLGPSLTEVPHFYDKICSSLLNNQPVEMIDGMYRSVLSYSQVADIIFSLSRAETTLPPIINICSDKAYTKYELGLTLAKKLNVAPDLIIKISEKEGKKFFKEKRASSAIMDNTLLKTLLGKKTIYWEEDEC